jgi:hypothetical protein
MKLYFLNSFSKNTQIQNFMKICPVGTELFHDGHDEANSRFRNFANAPKNVACSRNHCCHGNVTIPSFCIVVDVEVAVSSIKPLSVAKKRKNSLFFHCC